MDRVGDRQRIQDVIWRGLGQCSVTRAVLGRRSIVWRKNPRRGKGASLNPRPLKKSSESVIAPSRATYVLVQHLLHLRGLRPPESGAVQGTAMVPCEWRCDVTLGLRKLIVISLCGIFIVANMMVVTLWLNRMGVIEGAASLRRSF